MRKGRRRAYEPYLFSEEINLKQRVLGFLDLKEFAAKGIEPVFGLDEIDGRGLQIAELLESPWSGSYWPTYQGIIAARYASRSFAELRPEWKEYYDFARANTLVDVVERGSEMDIDALSPAEKYDLLIGIPRAGRTAEGFLTPALWDEGRAYYERYGRVETWMGICHGWAPASFMVSRPGRAIVARGLHDRVSKLKFYPADTKGLISLLWAKGESDESFFGGRCNNKTPNLDPETGRVMDSECFDVNPAFWHLTVINQIGLARRSLIIDASFDYEVWNQPVKAYKYTYFNPQTGETAQNARDAIVKQADYTKDKFKKFRSSKAVAFVGVQMELTYVSENWNFQSETDDASSDVYRTVSYLYDLELDSDGNVVGGEWYRNEHPDFEWLPAMGTKAVTAADRQISRGDWDPSRDPVPAFWRDIAIANARVNGEPLAAIVEPLAAFASGHR